MATHDPRVDAYIEKSAEFARPILLHLREVVHAACPKAEEAMKWGFPHFMYRGMLCHMAAFKQHCAFGFWKAPGVVESGGPRGEQAMGQFGRITSPADLPPDEVLAGYVREAMRQNENGTGARARARKPAQDLAVPGDLAAALADSAKARATFDGFSPSQRREYVEWITGAKTEDTRARRLATAVEWMEEGKPRNWKYIRPKP